MEDIIGNRSKSNQTFAGAKLDWMTANGQDRRLKKYHSWFKIGFYLAQHVNKRTRKAYPTEQYLADLVGCSLSTVERAMRAFRKTGWLHVEYKRDYDHKTETWKTRSIYTLLNDNVQTMLDEITELRRRRRDDFKPVTGDGQTPSKLKYIKSKALKHEALKIQESTKEESTNKIEASKLEVLKTENSNTKNRVAAPNSFVEIMARPSLQDLIAQGEVKSEALK